MSEPDFTQIWDFAERLSINAKDNKQTPPASTYMLARTAWDDLLRSLASSNFTVAEVPKPVGIRAEFKGADASGTEMCWVIDQRDHPRYLELGVICLLDPAAVLVVLRSQSTSLEGLALELAGQGIPFLMPQRLDLVQPADDTARYLRRQAQVGQWRSANYHFKSDDYLSFMSIFRSTVREDSQVRRLVLLSGGCPWRLALPYCDIEDVLSSPSGYAASSASSLRVRFAYRDVVLVEDRLLDEEHGMLVGQFQVPTHRSASTNIMHSSFFPTEKTWLASVRGHVGWTSANEDYLHQLDGQYRTIKRDDGEMALVHQPLASSRWAKQLGHFGNTHRVLAIMRRHAAEFLHHNIAHFTPA